MNLNVRFVSVSENSGSNRAILCREEKEPHAELIVELLRDTNGRDFFDVLWKFVGEGKIDENNYYMDYANHIQKANWRTISDINGCIIESKMKCIYFIDGPIPARLAKNTEFVGVTLPSCEPPFFARNQPLGSRLI